MRFSRGVDTGEIMSYLVQFGREGSHVCFFPMGFIWGAFLSPLSYDYSCFSFLSFFLLLFPVLQLFLLPVLLFPDVAGGLPL
jgi:hypothetical protein